MDDPLFLHHGESPGTCASTINRRKLLRLGLLSSEGFDAKNKLGFVDGKLTLSSPLVTTSSAI